MFSDLLTSEKIAYQTLTEYNTTNNVLLTFDHVWKTRSMQFWMNSRSGSVSITTNTLCAFAKVTGATS